MLSDTKPEQKQTSVARYAAKESAKVCKEAGSVVGKSIGGFIGGVAGLIGGAIAALPTFGLSLVVGTAFGAYLGAQIGDAVGELIAVPALLCLIFDWLRKNIETNGKDGEVCVARNKIGICEKWVTKPDTKKNCLGLAGSNYKQQVCEKTNFLGQCSGTWEEKSCETTAIWSPECNNEIIFEPKDPDNGLITYCADTVKAAVDDVMKAIG